VPNGATIVKGTFISGTVDSLKAEDGDYWVQGAAYDPTDPLAVINSLLYTDTNVSQSSYAVGRIKVAEKTNSANTKFRVRAVKANGGFVMLADNVPGSFTNITIQADFPQPVSDFINGANNNSMRLEIRNSSSNKLAGFFRHSVDLVQWDLYP
jgi:hypothetical protein